MRIEKNAKYKLVIEGVLNQGVILDVEKKEKVKDGQKIHTLTFMAAITTNMEAKNVLDTNYSVVIVKKSCTAPIDCNFDWSSIDCAFDTSHLPMSFFELKK